MYVCMCVRLLEKSCGLFLVCLWYAKKHENIEKECGKCVVYLWSICGMQQNMKILKKSGGRFVVYLWSICGMQKKHENIEKKVVVDLWSICGLFVVCKKT